MIAFGDAAVLGDMTGTTLNGPVLDSVATPSGQGYYMVASDGGIFAFGDARFAGSMGGKRLNAPVRSLVPDGDGTGYWLVAADGGVFAFDAPFRGSMGGRPLNKPVPGMVRYGDGYLMVGEDGGIFAFSDLPLHRLARRPPAGQPDRVGRRSATTPSRRTPSALPPDDADDQGGEGGGHDQFLAHLVVVLPAFLDVGVEQVDPPGERAHVDEVLPGLVEIEQWRRRPSRPARQVAAPARPKDGALAAAGEASRLLIRGV